ncbi:MAG: phosphopantothenoylcysteine decarboxylase [Thermogutta sp.]|nr:phosphopantothenoylcysteine decarboxylase [Thermogutta sp.]
MITSGPTREYLDPVRYLSNASSGRMGSALAEAFLAAGHEVRIVSGPVEIAYPPGCRVRFVTTTEEMLHAAIELFADCDGVIGAAAPCDFRPAARASDKIVKTGDDLYLRLVETPDILAALAAAKQGRWIVGFALETRDGPVRAMQKLQRKQCDLIILNHPPAIHSDRTEITAFTPDGAVLGTFIGSKTDAARAIYGWVERRLLH